MKVDRRTFLSSAVTSGAALVLNPQFGNESQIPIPADFKVVIMATNWGYPGSSAQFCAQIKKDGYDGLEVVWPTNKDDRQTLMSAIHEQQLNYAFLIGIWDAPDFASHLKRFEANLRDAAATHPLYINCHAGKDHYSFEQNKQFIDVTARVHQEFQVPVYHETHRGRILYAAPVAQSYLDKIPDLRVTLDISHWCSVHESLLSDQSDAVNLALSRTDHIHARIGHAEGPQVNDPRAPEWKDAVDAHLNWWDKVIKNKIASGAKLQTFLTEFGPADYMPALPYTRQPVANQWEINVFMLQLLRKRYSS